jgi:hypothetical protein
MFIVRPDRNTIRRLIKEEHKEVHRVLGVVDLSRKASEYTSDQGAAETFIVSQDKKEKVSCDSFVRIRQATCDTESIGRVKRVIMGEDRKRAAVVQCYLQSSDLSSNTKHKLEPFELLETSDVVTVTSQHIMGLCDVCFARPADPRTNINYFCIRRYTSSSDAIEGLHHPYARVKTGDSTRNSHNWPAVKRSTPTSSSHQTNSQKTTQSQQADSLFEFDVAEDQAALNNLQGRKRRTPNTSFAGKVDLTSAPQKRPKSALQCIPRSRHGITATGKERK